MGFFDWFSYAAWKVGSQSSTDPLLSTTIDSKQIPYSTYDALPRCPTRDHGDQRLAVDTNLDELG